MARKGKNKKKKKTESLPLLHVYGQHAWHDEVVIIGNKQALEILQAAVKQALKDGRSEMPAVFTADGEGYNVIILRWDVPWPEEWTRLALPYTADCARDGRENVLRPWDLVTSSHP